MNGPVDLTTCARESIHIPGTIQPHGLLLVVDAVTGRVAHAAGDVEGRLGTTDWLGARLESLLGADVATAILAGKRCCPVGFSRRARPRRSTSASRPAPTHIWSSSSLPGRLRSWPCCWRNSQRR